MVVKQPREYHFTKHFGEVAFSHRVILPGRDDSRGKVTMFFGNSGCRLDDIRNDVDETVYIRLGVVMIECEGSLWHLEAGSFYVVPAGQVYSIEVECDGTEAICFYSQAEDGTLPQDEPDPESE